MAVITHESVHAALGWFRRRHGEVKVEQMPDEELLCYAADCIASTIVSKVQRLYP